MYEDRPFSAPKFVGGARQIITKRLIALQSKYGSEGEVVREYKFAYQNNNLAEDLQLVRLQECGMHGQCFSPTLFEWDVLRSFGDEDDFDRLKFLTSKEQNFNPSKDKWIANDRDIDRQRLKYGDFNGDGRMDIYYVNGYGDTAKNDRIYFSDKNGQFSHDNTIAGISTVIHSDDDLGTGVDIARIQFGDFNGDGKTDIYYIRGWGDEISNEDKIYFLENGSWQGYKTGIFSEVRRFDQSSLDVRRMKFADFNGDGRTDVYRMRSGDTGWQEDRVWFSQ